MKFQAGSIRPAANGRGLEYLAQQGFTNKRGYWEVWEPVATHAIKHMPLPREFMLALADAGFAGVTLHDLLLAEGWRPPEDGYLELQPAPREIRG